MNQKTRLELLGATQETEAMIFPVPLVLDTWSFLIPTVEIRETTDGTQKKGRGTLCCLFFLYLKTFCRSYDRGS